MGSLFPLPISSGIILTFSTGITSSQKPSQILPAPWESDNPRGPLFPLCLSESSHCFNTLVHKFPTSLAPPEIDLPSLDWTKDRGYRAVAILMTGTSLPILFLLWQILDTGQGVCRLLVAWLYWTSTPTSSSIWLQVIQKRATFLSPCLCLGYALCLADPSFFCQQCTCPGRLSSRATFSRKPSLIPQMNSLFLFHKSRWINSI